MAFVPTPGVYRVAINALAFDNEIANVIAVRSTGADTPANAQAVAGAVFNAWEANVLPQLSAFYGLRSVQAWSQTNQEAPTGVYTEGDSKSGGIVGEAAPLHSAFVMTLRTANRGRSARGRIYLGPLGETGTNAGFVSAAYRAAIGGGLTNFWSDLTASGLVWGVLSLRTGGAPRTAGAFYPITALEARSDALGTQQRRQGRD